MLSTFYEGERDESGAPPCQNSLNIIIDIAFYPKSRNGGYDDVIHDGNGHVKTCHARILENILIPYMLRF
jgi:hypothetical protein